MRRLASFLDSLFRFFSLGHPGRMLFYGVIIGAVSALGAIVFFYVLEVTHHFLFDTLCHYSGTQPAGEVMFDSEASQESTRWWLFFLLPIAGAGLSGLVVYRWAPEAEGVGTEAMIDSFHNRRGIIRFRVPFIKAAASILTLSTGGSVGREGPISQIGAGLGSFLARRLHLGARQRRILLLAGAAGGLGAIFRAPLGGAISAVEVLYSEDFESEALLPSIISSVTAYILFSSVYGYDRIFDMPHVSFTSPGELPFYLVLALLCIPVGIFYVRFFHGFMRRIKAMPIPKYVRPMVGGFLVAVLGLFSPLVYGTSWGVIQDALLGNVALTTMLLLAGMKILATSFTLGSGGSGGVFGPTLFIGAMLGGAVGIVGQQIAPGVVTEPHAYVMVGMAAFFAGVANAPLGVLLMVCEITGGYNLIAPLLLVSVVAILFTRGYSIFPSQVTDKFHSPAHLGDVTFNILEDIQVRSCARPLDTIPRFPANVSLQHLPDWVVDPEVRIILVTGRKGDILGFVSSDMLRAIPQTGAMPSLIILYDIMEKFRPVYLDDDLFQALRTARRMHLRILPVMDRNRDEVTGCIEVDDIMDAYAREVAAKTRGED